MKIAMTDIYKHRKRNNNFRNTLLTSLLRSAWTFLGAGLLLYSIDSFNKRKQQPLISENYASTEKPEIDWEQMHLDYYYYKNGPLVTPYTSPKKHDPLEEWVPKPEWYRDFLRTNDLEKLKRNPYKNMRGEYE